MKKPQIECLESPSTPLSSHNRSGAILAAFLAALCAAAAVGDTLDTTPFSKKIPITISGYAGSTELTDFPVLVTLAENAPIGFSYDDCATDGADLRFADATGALLSHEIETWDKTGTSCVWVKVPSIVGTATKITCYYGADGAATLPTVSATDVWSRYAAVFHGGASIADATGHATAITVNGATTETTGGKAGGVLKKGTSNGVQFSNPVKFGALSSIDSFSFSGWFKKSGGTSAVLASNKGKDEWAKNGFVALVEGGNYFSVGVGVNNSGAHQGESGKGALVTGTWGHLAFAYDKSATSLHSYFNGEGIYSTPSARNILDPGKSVWAFGGFFDGNKNCFQGDMDEVRVLNGTASPDWIKAEYDSVNTPASFAVPGTVEAVDHSAPVLGTPVLSRNANGSFTVSVEVSGAAPASIVCTAGGTDFAMTTADAALPATYAAVVSGLAAGTCTATVRATATSGTEVSAACPTAFHVGALVATVVANADEGTLTAGAFRIARADSDAAGLPALTVGVAFSGAGLSAVADPGMASVTIPADEASVDIAITPIYTAAVDVDSELVLSVTGDTVGTFSDATMTVVNATFDPAVRYVATTGDDANHGGTPEMPKLTIGAAVASLEDVAQSTPCTIHVAPGRYAISTPLSLTKAVKLVGDDGDPSLVVVSNTANVAWGNANHRCILVNHANAWVSGMTFENGKDYDNGGNVRIDTNGGVVTNCILSGGFTRQGNDSGGANVAITGPGLVTHCKIFGGDQNNCNGGDRVSSVYLEHANARIENCLVEGFKGATVSSQPTVGCAGIVVNKGAAVNCTVADCTSPYTTASGFAGILVWANGVATNCVSVSNVDSNGTVRAFMASQAARTSHCAFDAIDGETTIPEGMPNAVVGTAAEFFKDYANGDYTPKTDGPLVNKGANYEGMASVDLAGNPRKIGSKIDIGCYEARSSSLAIIIR